MGLKIVGSHIFIFFWKKDNLMHFERHFAFQNAYKSIFPENLKQILGFTSKFRYGRVTLNTAIFYLVF